MYWQCGMKTDAVWLIMVNKIIMSLLVISHKTEHAESVMSVYTNLRACVFIYVRLYRLYIYPV